MNEFKYQFVNFLLLVLLGFGIYWAFTTIDNGIIYDQDDVVSQTATTQVDNMPLNDEVNQEQEVFFDNTQEQIKEKEQELDQEENNQNSSHQKENTTHDGLLQKLQKMVDNKVRMDIGASGDNVGTIQSFLALYFPDRHIVVDKDFGPTTKKLVKEFQQKELNGGGGNIGPNTLGAMVKWLQKQS